MMEHTRRSDTDPGPVTCR